MFYQQLFVDGNLKGVDASANPLKSNEFCVAEKNSP
jgi:hypothetical protein